MPPFQYSCPLPLPHLRDALNQGWRQILIISRDSLSPFEGELFAHLWSLNATSGVEVFDSHLAQGCALWTFRTFAF